MSTFVKTGVIGHPVNHSLSPRIHNFWIEKYQLEGAYEAIDCAPLDLADTIKRLVDSGYRGFNVTLPHKETIMKLCDTVDLNAQNIGAVNTVVIEDGRLRGLNTDGFGFLANIYETEPGYAFDYKCAVVLGAGGAARAVVSALIGEQIEKIILLNRTRANAQILADEMNMGTGIIEVRDWDERAQVLKDADMLVNTTSLGMTGQPPLEIDLQALSANALVNDIVYAPLDTPLLKQARARGALAISGIGMLLHQARPAFNEWFGVAPEVTEELRERVLK
jgi:shikimate dehydrogenase